MAQGLHIETTPGLQEAEAVPQNESSVYCPGKADCRGSTQQDKNTLKNNLQKL